MTGNSLASSRKAWRAIQAITGRVVYGAKYNQIADGDKLDLPTLSTNDHPWKYRRSGNTIRFTPGLVHGVTASAANRRIVTDAGGYVYTPGTPVYLYLKIQAIAGAPFELITEVDNGGGDIVTTTSVYAPVEPFCRGANFDSSFSPPAGFEDRFYHAAATVPREDYTLTFSPPNFGTEFASVPFLYITDTDVVQLLTENVMVATIGANRNLILCP